MLPFTLHKLCALADKTTFVVFRIKISTMRINDKYSSYMRKFLFLIMIFTYRVSKEECAILRESVPYVKLYRYNPKHLYPNLNGYGDNGQRKVWTSCISAFCTPTAVSRAIPPSSHLTACGAYVG